MHMHTQGFYLGLLLLIFISLGLQKDLGVRENLTFSFGDSMISMKGSCDVFYALKFHVTIYLKIPSGNGFTFVCIIFVYLYL